MANNVAIVEAVDGSRLEIDLKDPRLAAFLAWLIPGLGHLYQGRTGKGILFFVCILGTFFYGLYIGGGRVVYASSPSIFTRWQYFCQLGVGVPAMPALVQTMRVNRGKEPLRPFGRDFMRPPQMRGGPFESDDTTNASSTAEVASPDELAKWNYEYGDLFDLGTVFTVIAGLLNILVIYDAYGGPLVIPALEEKKKPTDDRENSEASGA